MHFLVLAASLSLAAAQGTITSASYSSRTTSTRSAVTHTVNVAKANHAFDPDVILAVPGDVIEYQFYPTNHSVIRASYGYPCVPYELVEGVDHFGFFSGFKPVDAVLAAPPIWRLTVNDTDPVFFYCGAPGSCNGFQMVGVINPSANTSLQHQKDLAKEADFVLLPGDKWPSEAGTLGYPVSSGRPSATSSATPSPTAVTSPSATAAPVASHGIGTGAIAGIAIGGSAVLLMAFFAIWYCGRQSRRSHTPPPAGPVQEVYHGYPSGVPSMYNKSAHMSVMSGYNLPPGYDQHGMQSPPHAPTPVDPAMMNPNGVSPHLRSVSPTYGQPMQNMYAPGTHHIAPVEMPSVSQLGSSPRRSTDKPGPPGVERYG